MIQLYFLGETSNKVGRGMGRGRTQYARYYPHLKNNYVKKLIIALINCVGGILYGSCTCHSTHGDQRKTFRSRFSHPTT